MSEPSPAPTQAVRIISKFGGLAALARALGPDPETGKETARSVIQGWKERGFIPANRQQDVLDAAARAGIDLQPADFFDRASADEAA